MPLITKAVPNLIQGVSQQAEQQRLDGQSSEQENALSSVVDGLMKRPQTSHIVEMLSSAITSSSFVHFINRSPEEQYVVFYDKGTGKLYAYNIITGEEATIDGATGGLVIGSTNYLSCTTPRDELKALTVNDKTFILNKTRIVAPSDSDVSPSLAKEAICFIKQGDFEKKYGLTLQGDFADTAVNRAKIVLTIEMYKQGTRPPTFHWRVKSVAIEDIGGTLTAGQDYVVGEIGVPNITSSIFATAVAGTAFTGGGVLNKIFDQPAFSFTVNSTTGAIETVNVTRTGKFGYQLNSDALIADKTITLELNPPTGQALYNTNPASIIAAEITSGANTGTGSEDVADTTTILNRLVDAGGAEAADLADKGITTTSTTSSDEFSLSKRNNLLVLTRSGNGGDFDITAHDGLAGNGMGVAYKKIDAISSLPVYNKDGFKIKVVGSTFTDADDYYVEFKTSNNVDVGNGVYEECLAPDTVKSIDVSTMPFVLTNNGVNSFTTGTMDIAERKVGSEKSNPMPSFVGQKINDIFLYKNRLGFVSEDDVTLSEANLGAVEDGVLKFNFFRTTVTQLLDSDPIDVTVSSTKVTDLKAAIGYQENLILFSESGQFALKGGQLLTPTSISVAPITNFEYDQIVKPIPIGSYIYFPFNRGSFTGVQEFVVSSNTDNYDATEITEHVPNYIPANLSVFKGSSSEDILLAFAPTEPKNIYVYKYFFSNQKKILTSWSKFVFDFDVINFEIFQGLLYIVGTKESKTHLIRMNLQTGVIDQGATYNTLLDMRRKLFMGQSGNISPSSETSFARTTTSTTVVPLEYTASAGDTIVVYDDDGNKLALNESMPLSGTATQVTLSSAHTGTIYVGLPYTMKYTFSQPFIKLPSGNTKAPSGFLKNKIRNGSIFFSDSSGFDIKVTPENRTATTSTYVNPFSDGTTVNLQSGSFRFPVVSDLEGTVISIESDDVVGTKFTSAEFEIFIHQRGNRVA